MLLFHVPLPALSTREGLVQQPTAVTPCAADGSHIMITCHALNQQSF
jgi:hypothetical protein